jgi:hypothetical protein
VSVESVPVGALAAWGLFPAPGEWSGRLASDARLARTDGRLQAWGVSELVDGRVRGLALLDEVETLWGGERSGQGLRVETLRARWSSIGGAFFAESLLVEVPSLRAEGSLYRSDSDSLAGWLRVRPRGDPRWESIFLLLGGSREAIDLSVAGTLRRPEIAPIGANGRLALIERLKAIASAFPAPPGEIPGAPRS